MSSFDSLKVDELRNAFQGKSKSKKHSTKSTNKPKKRSRKTKAEKIVESPYFDELDQSLNQSDDDLPQTKKPKHKSVSLKSSKKNEKKSSKQSSKKSKVVQLGAPEDSRSGLNSQAAPIQHDLVNLTRNVASFFGPNSLFLGQQHSIGPIDNGLLDKFEKQ
jgi:hypothetical protein